MNHTSVAEAYEEALRVGVIGMKEELRGIKPIFAPGITAVEGEFAKAEKISGMLARMIPEVSISIKRMNIKRPPKGVISVGADSFKINSSKLLENTYYPFLFRGEKYFVQKIDETIALYESFELKTGELLVHELFRLKSE